MARENEPRRRGPGGPPGGPGRPVEKAKDLKGTWLKLLRYCKKYWAAIIIAVIAALLGTICTLAGPDQLSNLTDAVTEGITPHTDVLEEITSAMSAQIPENFEALTEAITQGMTANNGVPQSIEVNGVTISDADQMELMILMDGTEFGDEEALSALLSQLPESITEALYSDLTIDGTVISGADQREMVDLLSQLDIDSEDTSAVLEVLDQLPESVYDLVKPTIDMTVVTRIGLTLAAVYIAAAILSASQGWIMATVTARVSRRLRTEISQKINRLPMSFFHHTSTGDVLSRVTNDVDTISQSMNQSIGNLVSALALLIGSLVMMLLTNVILTLTAVVATLIGFALMMTIMKHSQKYFSRQQKHLGQLNGHVEEIYTGHTVVRAYNGEAEAKETFDQLNHQLRDSLFKAQSLSGLMMPVMSFIGNFGYVAVCVVGAVLAQQGTISFGVIVAFMMYVRYFTQPLSQIAQAMQTLQSAAAAGERVFEFLEAQEMEDESHKPQREIPDKGTVDFEHVHFGYDPDRVIIHDFSAHARPGQKVAIVGPTGAGKTTLVNLLMRFYEVNGGEIIIDGIPSRELTREQVHSQFCMVLQDTWLFEGTVRENLAYCTENVTDEQMRTACKAVGLDHFIRTLPKGYDTVLNDQVNLSAGQKQQLTIARAMIADKPMLILDEATSSVDTRTELKIQEAMDKLMEKRTSFVIAHRLSTIKNADLILVLKDGDIIESGTHQELLDQGGFYAELYNSQFDKEEESA